MRNYSSSNLVSLSGVEDLYVSEEETFTEMSVIENGAQLEVLNRLSITMFTTLILSSIIGVCGNSVILFLIFGTSTFRR